MFEQIYPLFKYLTDIPVNFWSYLLLAIPPILVFSIRPDANVWLRIGRLLLAIVCTYVLINLTLHTSRALQWKAYEQCRSESQHRIDSHEMHEECKYNIDIADGASNIFYLYFGWIPATAYIGLWEYVWRRVYGRSIAATADHDWGEKISAIVGRCTRITPLILILFLLQLFFIIAINKLL